MFLNAHSWFSFKYGVMKPEALLGRSAEGGCAHLALTDIHCTAGIPDFVRDAHRFGVRPVAGIEFRQGRACCTSALRRTTKASSN
jgi:DNA polymerase III alpha subunit